jgi:hypothetical protein
MLSVFHSLINKSTNPSHDDLRFEKGGDTMEGSNSQLAFTTLAELSFHWSFVATAIRSISGILNSIYEQRVRNKEQADGAGGEDKSVGAAYQKETR